MLWVRKHLMDLIFNLIWTQLWKWSSRSCMLSYLHTQREIPYDLSKPRLKVFCICICIWTPDMKTTLKMLEQTLSSSKGCEGESTSYHTSKAKFHFAKLCSAVQWNTMQYNNKMENNAMQCNEMHKLHNCMHFIFSLDHPW